MNSREEIKVLLKEKSQEQYQGIQRGFCALGEWV